MFGIIVAEEICNKSVPVYPPHLFIVLIPYIVKNYDPLTCVYNMFPFVSKNITPFYFFAITRSNVDRFLQYLLSTKIKRVTGCIDPTDNLTVACSFL